MIQINKLTNGIQVALDPMSSIQSISIGVCVGSGSAREEFANNGISHMIEHMFFKGTKLRDAKQLANDMAKLGGEVNAYTTKEYTMFYVTTISLYAKEAIELLADMICNSSFDPRDIEKEKEVVYEEIDMYDDSADDVVHERLHEAVWTPHPLSFMISGSKEQVSQLTREQILEYRDTWYQADNMTIALAGAIDLAGGSQRILSILQECFGDISSKGIPDNITTPEYQPAIFEKQMDIEQIHLNLCFPGANYHSEERYCQYLLSGILGGNDNSRLFQSIREKWGLTYSIDSYDSFFSRAGLFHVDAVLNPKKQDEVIRRILDEFANIRDREVSEEELMMSKEQIRIGVLLGMESSRERMLQHARQLLFYRRIISEEEYLSSMQSVTGKQLKVYANKLLQPQSMGQSLVGCINTH